MKIKLENIITLKEVEVSIKYPVKSKTVERLISLIKSVDIQISCYSDDDLILVNASDIYYIESIDKKTIICGEKEKFSVKERLYQVYEKLKPAGFVQINKYCILNINKLEKIKPLPNSNLEAVLKNRIHLNVSRKYLTDIKQILQENS
jgi:DNA-binding LytR/AlgR family response regulator